MKFLHIVVVIGTLANLVKAGELILTPDQQKRLQEWAESVALRFADSRRFSVMGRLVKENRLAVSIMSLAMSIGLTMLMGWPVWKYAPELALFVARMLGAGVSTLTLVWVLDFPTIAPDENTEHSNDDNITKLIYVALRGFLTSLIAAAVGVYWANTRHAVVVGPETYHALSRANIEAYSVVFCYSAALVPIIGATLWVVLDLTLGACWYVARWFTWRIAVYSKGAWAALVLVATVVLGILDVALRYK
jgi:hypothetical protein